MKPSDGNTLRAGKPVAHEDDRPEIISTAIYLRVGDQAEFSYRTSSSNSLASVYLVVNDGPRQQLAESKGVNEVNVVLPPLPVGRHLLYWGFQGAALIWRTNAELSVGGVCRFRHRKSSDSKDPVNRGFLLLEVLAVASKKPASNQRKERER